MNKNHLLSMVVLIFVQISSVQVPILVSPDEDYQSGTMRLGGPELKIERHYFCSFQYC